MQLTSLLKKLTTLGNIYHLPNNWLVERPYLFSNTVFTLPSEQATIIRNTIRAIEIIVDLPAFQVEALSNASAMAKKNRGNLGVLFGYDFHLTSEGPKLIEINTNAGGSFFVALLEEANGKKNALKRWEEHFIKMFLSEWQNKNPTQSLKTIAIIDDDPLNQYFYPEFLLFQTLFQRHNIHTMIADSTALFFREKKLWVDDTPIDLIYNRLTDFDFSQPKHHVLKQAYTKSQTVITPHPYAHALYAHKRNLALLSDTNLLMHCGVDEKTIHQLQKIIPKAHVVNPAYAENLWAMRKQYFFKPVSGHGGKGVYRGQNITRHVFNEILTKDYIAQTLIPPSEMQVEGERRKVDLRAYSYAGEVIGFAARLYQGQTTNMRTPGGGFTMVEEV